MMMKQFSVIRRETIDIMISYSNIIVFLESRLRQLDSKVFHVQQIIFFEKIAI